MRDDVPELGPQQLKALTHPLRVRLLRELRTDGPATATALAKRVGESSGSTSYHLRQLERHGFVEEVPASGNGRDRWWQPAFRGHRVDTAKWLDDPEERGVVSLYQSEILRSYAESATDFVAQEDAGEWSRDWVDAADMSDFRLHLTPAQLKRLVTRMHALVASYEKHRPARGEDVSVQLFAFPRRARPFEEAE